MSDGLACHVLARAAELAFAADVLLYLYPDGLVLHASRRSGKDVLSARRMLPYELLARAMAPAALLAAEIERVAEAVSLNDDVVAVAA